MRPACLDRRQMPRTRNLVLSATAILALAGAVPAGADGAAAKTLEQVMLQPAMLAPRCKPIEGEFAISMQARAFYAMAEKGEMTDLVPPPAHKAWQSFDCGGERSTIYYYEYRDEAEFQRAFAFAKGFIWGEGGRSAMHPEYLIPESNMLVVISSRDAEYFANALFYGIPGEAGKTFKEAIDIYGTQNYAKAEKRFREMTKSAPDNALGHLYVGHCLFYQGKYHDAIAAYERAGSLGSRYGSLERTHLRILSDNLGMAYAFDGRMPDAKATFEAAIRRDPDYPMSYYNLACAFAEMGDVDNAIANLKQGYARRANNLPGESLPDPRGDDSFKRYLGDPKFKAALAEMGY